MHCTFCEFIAIVKARARVEARVRTRDKLGATQSGTVQHFTHM